MDAQQPYVIVTGGNRGIGFATVKALADRGVHVILTARDVTRGEAAAVAIRQAHSKATVEVMPLDLASLASVRQFAELYKAKGVPLHALINNAGALGLGRQIQFTADGFELEFGINHLGHFLLTNLLLPVLKASAPSSSRPTALGPSRVITVSSIRHIPGKGGKGAAFDFDNLKGEKSYDPRLTYNNTKLANVWFTHALQRRLEGTGMIALAACPGFVPQTVGATKSGLSRFFYDRVLMLIPAARTADVAGRELADLTLGSAVTAGAFYADGHEMRSSDASYDDASAEQLWELSEQWVGLHDVPGKWNA